MLAGPDRRRMVLCDTYGRLEPGARSAADHSGQQSQSECGPVNVGVSTWFTRSRRELLLADFEVAGASSFWERPWFIING
jgi:hypothetical protein